MPNLLASGCKVLVITDPDSEIENLFAEHNLSLAVNNWDNNFLIEKLNFLIYEDINIGHQKTIAESLFTIDKMILKVFR